MMFHYADADGDGKISWKEFQTMINPPKPPEPPKPSLADLASRVTKKEENHAPATAPSPDTQPLSAVSIITDTVSSNCAQVSWGSIVHGTPT